MSSLMHPSDTKQQDLKTVNDETCYVCRVFDLWHSQKIVLQTNSSKN